MRPNLRLLLKPTNVSFPSQQLQTNIYGVALSSSHPECNQVSSHGHCTSQNSNDDDCAQTKLTRPLELKAGSCMDPGIETYLSRVDACAVPSACGLTNPYQEESMHGAAAAGCRADASERPLRPEARGGKDHSVFGQTKAAIAAKHI